VNPYSPGLSQENAEKSLAIASALFSGGKWVAHGEWIFAAKSLMAGWHKEQAKLYREISDARILTNMGSAAYFLLEQTDGEGIGKRYADTVIDRAIVELTTISGNRTTLGKSFFTVESVRAKLAGELKTPLIIAAVFVILKLRRNFLPGAMTNYGL
jgi:hypothetical protein